MGPIKLERKQSLSQGVELPIDGLPASIQEYINAVCGIYHCPREFVAVAALSMAATAVGKKMKVCEGKYVNSLALWFILVARSGSNKSYPMKLVSEPLRKIDAELFNVYKGKYDVWRATPARERTEDEPRCPSLVLDDCTDERRSEILFANSTIDQENDGKRGAVGIYPEVKGMFDSKNQYQNGGTTAVSKLLRLFDGEDIKVDRRTAGTMLIRDPFFNIIGDLQTSMLRATFGNEIFMTNGLNQRFLFCLAEDIDYPKRSHETLPRTISAQWHQTIQILYENIYHAGTGEHITIFRSSDGLAHFSPDADALYDDYYNSLQEKKDRSNSDYEASIYSKLQIQVIRLAGIVHALELVEERGTRLDYNFIHGGTMAYAIRCMQYFEHMAKLVYQKLTEPPAYRTGDPKNKEGSIRALLQAYPNTKQKDLARAIGVSEPFISKIKNDKSG